MPVFLSRNLLERRRAICAISAMINCWFLVSGRLATVVLYRWFPRYQVLLMGPVTHGQTYVSSEEIWITIRSSLFSHIRFTCIHVCTGMQSCVKIHCHGTDFKPFMPALLSRNFLEHRHTICAIGATINSWFLASGRPATVEHSKQVLSTPKDCCLKDLWWVGFNTYMSWP